MTTIRKNIVTASAAALVLGFAVAATATPAAADDAGPLGWTYNIKTGTYAGTRAVSQGSGAAETSADFERLDPTSELAYNVQTG